MSNLNQDTHIELKEEYLKECSLYNSNSSKRAQCANELGKLYYGYAQTMPLSIEYYLIAYNIEPENPEYIHNLSRAYYFVEDFVQAKPFLQKCTEADLPNLEKSICAAKLSSICSRNNQNLEAAKYMEAAYSFEPEEFNYIYSLAMKYVNIKRYNQAEKYLLKCANTNVSDYTNKYSIANCAYELGNLYYEEKLETANYTAIVSNFYKAYQLLQEKVEYLQKLAVVLYKFNEIERAKALFIECIENNNNYTSYNDANRAKCTNWLANIFLTDKKPHADNITDAANAYALARNLDKDNPLYNYNFALLSFQYNENVNATKGLLENCLKFELTTSFTNSEKSKCANKLATLYFEGHLKLQDKKSTTDEIIKYYKLAYELYPDKSYQFNLAVTYYLAGLYKESAPLIVECKENKAGLFNLNSQQKCTDLYLELIGVFISNEFSFD